MCAISPADPQYIEQLENGIVTAAVRAHGSARAAETGLAMADSTGVGTNRRDPAGPSDQQVPVFGGDPSDHEPNRRHGGDAVCSTAPDGAARGLQR